MDNAPQICRICLSINVKMYTLKNTNIENLYKLLTQAYLDIEDGKPAIVCFLCHARLQQCERLQQQAIKSNELLEQWLKDRFMHSTENAILSSQYTSQDLQVSSIYHLDLEPVTCEVVFLHPKLEANGLISVGEEKETTDKGYSVIDFPEGAHASYDLEPEAFRSHPEDDELSIAICSIKSDDIGHGMKMRKQYEEENQCIIQYEKKVSNDPHLCNSTLIQRKGSCNINKEAKLRHSEDTQKIFINRVETSVINTIIDEFQCNECGKQFSTEDTLTDHIHNCMKNAETSVNDSQLEMYKCDICTFKTYNKPSIETHIKMHSITKVLSCNICEYRCAYKCQLKVHIKKHTGEKPFSCDICEYRCAVEGNLKKHMRKHTGEKPFSCNICKYRCAQKTDLKRHIRIHTGEIPFSCITCQYRCVQKSDLKQHIRTHTGEKPFSCNVCKYRCAKKYDIKRHMKTHTGEKPFLCNICEYRCAYKQLLKLHMKTHTGEKPFSCNICEYRCTQKSDLKRHMRKHTGEEPYSCNICEYRCAQKGNLKRHLITHTGKKSYSCNICKYSCGQKIDLKLHFRTHT